MLSDGFNPTEIWDPLLLHYEFDEEIDRARYDLTQLNTNCVVADLTDAVEKAPNGTAYAILTGETPESYSTTDALVVFNSTANGATPNMLYAADFIRRVASYYDVRDDQGKLKPLVMLASPSIGSDVHLTPEDKKRVSSGELGPVASEMLRVLKYRDFGRVTLLGFSQGADMVLAGARKAYSLDLDVQAVAAGDNATVEDRSRWELIQDMRKVSNRAFMETIELSNVNGQRQLVGSKDFARFVVSAFGKTINWHVIYRGLGKNTFEKRMQTIIDEGQVNQLVAAYGSNSDITKPAEIEPSLSRLYAANGTASVHSIRVEGADHSWGDNFGLLAKLYMRAAVS